MGADLPIKNAGSGLPVDFPEMKSLSQLSKSAKVIFQRLVISSV
jgi:hypothetical protein